MTATAGEAARLQGAATLDPGASAPRDFAALATRLIASGLVTDPWVDGAPRFGMTPLQLGAATAASLARAAEDVAAVAHEAVLLVMDEPALLDEFFGLTPAQQAMFAASAPAWHGIARADVFLVDDGAGGQTPVVCELNADTPSGQAEAVLLGDALGVPEERDPNRGLEARFGQLLTRALADVRRVNRGARPVLGIVYPTEVAGDFGLVRLYQRWATARGFDVRLGSPFNLTATEDGGVALFGQRCDLILRHYKTDWWGERLPIWSDEDPYPDAEPLAGPLAVVLRAATARRCGVINPFGAVLPQNKRLFAFFWEEIARFSAESQACIRAHVPFTMRLEAADLAAMRADRAQWVMKSDYGCEGEEVIVGAEVNDDEWAEALALALPRRFVAQRYFSATRNRAGDIVNHGVYLVGGQAAGIYARAAAGSTDVGARSVAVEIVP